MLLLVHEAAGDFCYPESGQMSQAAGALSLRLNCWGRQERMCHIKEKEQTKCPALKKHWSRGNKVLLL